jgi:3-dehydroquinate dehydratase / shikimate dehydrogenase
MTPPRPAFVVSVIAPDTDTALRRMHAVGPLADLIEIRLDGMRDPAVETLVRQSPCPVVLTCRRAEDGGAWSGDEGARLDLLRRCAASGAAWLDVELDRLDAIQPVESTRIIGSFHDPSGTPADLSGIVRRLRDAGADIAKVAVQARDLGDVARVLDLLAAESAAGPLAAHAMGETGRISRLVGPRFGTALVYAAAARGTEAAPGQPTIRDLRLVMRTQRMRPTTRLHAVLGADVSRSPSPALMNAAFEALDVDRAYVPFSCPDPGEALRRLPADLFAGFSVTIPHKESILPLLDEIEEAAGRAGAVNTLVLGDDGRLLGFNTDAPAIVEALRDGGCEELAGRDVIIVGAGGAARAAAVALDGQGARVFITGRTVARAETVAALVDGVAVDEANAPWASAVAVVQTTPLGSRPDDALPFDPTRLAPGTTVLDAVAVPPITRLLSAVKVAGGNPVSGREMFLAQAARQIRIWTELAPPRDVMRKAVEGFCEDLRPVALVGLRGSGKTTVGERLAERTGRAFIDTDVFLASGTGRTAGEILREDGEARFRDLEVEAVRRAIGTAGAVIALGGGAVESPETVRLLQETARVVWLDAPDADLLARTRDTSSRPALTQESRDDEVALLRARREPVYRALAAYVLNTAAPRTPDEVAGEAVSRLA